MDEISHFTQLVIDALEIIWKQGIHISHTASSPEGSDIEVTVALFINDLPAAYKVSGTAGHNTQGYYCTICNAKH